MSPGDGATPLLNPTRHEGTSRSRDARADKPTREATEGEIQKGPLQAYTHRTSNGRGVTCQVETRGDRIEDGSGLDRPSSSCPRTQRERGGLNTGRH